jgi:hypothetical protein
MAERVSNQRLYLQIAGPPETSRELAGRPGMTVHAPRCRLRSPLRFRTLLAAGLAAAVLLAACGPTEEQRVESAYALAATNPAAARTEIVKQWNAGELKLDPCIHLAHQRLDERHPSAPAFALSVLNAAQDLESAAEKAGVTEFYWFRLGTLAGAAAANAYNAGDIAGARELVLAGPRRWQGENYWRLHPDHDALASWILHQSGETQQALARLRERGEPDEQVAAMMQRIQADQRAQEAARQKR